MRTDRVDHCGLLANEQMARAMEQQAALLFDRLGRHEPHVCSRDRFANGLSVCSIVLLPLDVGLHVGRRHQTHGMPQRSELARPMMRRSAGFDTDEARRQLLKEWQNVPALELAANDHITCRVNSVNLKNRLPDIETDCRDSLHIWLLQIVGASTAPTSMALPCRWRSRPQHQNRTRAPQQRKSYSISRGAEMTRLQQWQIVRLGRRSARSSPSRSLVSCCSLSDALWLNGKEPQIQSECRLSR